MNSIDVEWGMVDTDTGVFISEYSSDIELSDFNGCETRRDIEDCLIDEIGALFNEFIASKVIGLDDKIDEIMELLGIEDDDAEV
jgi:hypothetical protein